MIHEGQIVLLRFPQSGACLQSLGSNTMPKLALFLVLAIAWFPQASFLGTDSQAGGWGSWTWARILAFALATALCVLLWATRWRFLTARARFWGTAYFLLAAIRGNLPASWLTSVEHFELECAATVLAIASTALFAASLNLEKPRTFSLTRRGDDA